jgi:catechol 2,3-dioxygenase-like lactoylglutathione lyase family enzyme
MEGFTMSLSSYRVGAVVAVSDMNRAKEFYEGKLGLAGTGDEPDGGRTYQCGGETAIHVFPSPGDVGTSGTTVAGWFVDDVEAVVDDLTAQGVAFEHYADGPTVTDEKGVAVLGSSKGAWFKDPDGNVLGLLQD